MSFEDMEKRWGPAVAQQVWDEIQVIESKHPVNENNPLLDCLSVILGDEACHG